MNAIHAFLVIAIFKLVVAEDECVTPAALKAKEEICWTEEVEVVDRIVQTSKNVLNFAKKKLGLAADEEHPEQKCEYYSCILRQLHMLNANDYPAMESIQEWIKRSVVYYQAVDLMEQLDKCSAALANSTIREINFNADQVDDAKSVDIREVSDRPIEAKEQTTCEISAEFLDCLSRQKKVCLKIIPA